MSASVRVVARIRPLLKLELDSDTIVSAEAAGNETPASPTVVRIPNPKNESESYTFQFNAVYDQQATQQEIFEKEVSPTVKHLFSGFDVTVFAYGVTGTGKTHTMRGGKSLADRGVIPRLLSAIFRRSRKIEKDSAGATQVEVAMSYYEIYNDRVYDLFEPPEKRTAAGLPIRDNNGVTVVCGLTERPCETLKEFEHLYDQANVNRSTSATKLNAHSSRSHAILCVKLTQTTGDTVRISRASAIDLAGSEDNRRTENNKDRMVESASINKSLFVLAQCVEAISKKQSRIPYRESKMTRILSLGQNNGLTLMILNLAPVRSYHLDTLSSLNFANRTKKIEVRDVENEPIFKAPAKPTASIVSSIAGTNVQRQPLRPLTSAHNTNLHDLSHKADKPVKAFSVYSDARKPLRPSNAAWHSVFRPTQSSKCGLDSSDNTSFRPAKTVRCSDARFPRSTGHHAEPALSATAIEAMIDAKLSQKLAERALSDANIAPAPPLPHDLQRRLDALEQRIEASEDKSREEGLHYLLMSKQHQARGEDTSALTMLQLAVPYFPNNEKLETKIAALKDKIQAKKQQQQQRGTVFEQPTIAPTAPASSTAVTTTTTKPPSKPKSRKLYRDHLDQDDSFHPDSSYHGDKLARNSASDDDNWHSPKRKPATKPTTTATTTITAKPKLAVFRDLSSSSSSSSTVITTSNTTSSSATTATDPPHSPRTAELLRIINSRDAARIRALRGVGAKKAEAIVSCLFGMDEDDDGWAVTDLEALARLKGVGARGVENMRAGLGEGVGCW